MAVVLIVDDDEKVRKMLRLTLANLGHDVIEGFDGKEGLALYAEFMPDIVVTDVIMPERDGLEFIRDMRARQPNAPIIAMSAGGYAEANSYLQIAKLMGATEVLTKPFSYLEFQDALQRALAHRSAG